jgi:serine/threonine protein kinase
MVAAIESRTLLHQRYLIKHLLGQGGFGRTYLALDRERFDEPCVLKEFTVSYQDETLVAKAKAMFAREASILHQVQHPQIPRFWAAFEWENRLFLVQDYIQGDNYRTLLQQRRDRGETLTEVEVLHLLNHLLPVLSYLHDRQIVHRDISPENLVLSPGQRTALVDGAVPPKPLVDYTAGLPVLLDFGSVKAATSGLALVSTMTRVGKVGYAPPEQLQTGQVQPHSDLYALAATCIVLLTGREPHQLLDSLTLDWHWQPYTQVSRELANILNRMLALHPTDRYPSAQAVYGDLQRLLGVLTPMLWRADATRWQGFTSPIHQSASRLPDAAVPIGHHRRDAGPVATPATAVLPPTQIQSPPNPSDPGQQRQPLRRFFTRSRHSSAATATQRMLTLTQAEQAESPAIAQRTGQPPLTPTIATLPPRLVAAPNLMIQPIDRLERWATHIVIATAGLVLGGIGLHLFGQPPLQQYQAWIGKPGRLAQTPARESVQRDQPNSNAPERLEFAPDEVAKTRQGTLQENQTQIYQFPATQDQIAAIALKGAGVRMNLLRADQQPIDNAARQVQSWSGVFPSTETYQIQITGSGSYSLALTLTAAHIPPRKTDERLDFSDRTLQTITGKVFAQTPMQYRFSAKRGQTIRVKVIQGDIQIKAIAPTGKPLGQSRTRWQGKVPVNGEYNLILSASQREDYAITIEVK